MPMHDWTRLDDCAYHDFRFTWAYAIRRRLNDGLLPTGYHARFELVPGRYRRRRVGIRHSSGDRLVAIIELVSPGNKASRSGVRAFVGKLVRAIDEGIHALVIDPFAPTRMAPDGLHALIRDELAGEPLTLPAGQPLTLAAYEAAVPTPKCYVERLAVGQGLPDMPLFLAPGVSIDLPVEATYQDAWREVVPQDRAALEAT